MQSNSRREIGKARERWWRAGARLGAVAALIAAGVSFAADGGESRRRTNGFVLSPADVAVREILHGGVGRDAIPALDHPTQEGVDAGWEDEDRVLGVTSQGEARAYPIAILVWHELVNDTLGGIPLLVSYCPLCGTGLVFDRRVGGGEPRRFGVSGLLYRSDLLMYDRETESLWSQISARAVTGASRGARLRIVRSEMTTWAKWKAAHPDTTVLSRDTGHRKPYGQNPYGSYARRRDLIFPAPFARAYHPKTPTVGLRLADGTARAYPSDEVAAAGGVIAERFGGHPVRVAWDAETETFSVSAPEPVEVVEGYWFAWSAFHPQTSVAQTSVAKPD